MYLSFIFYHLSKELYFFNNIAILEKLLKAFPSDITILESGAHYCHSTTRIDAASPAAATVKGEYSIAAIYEARIRTTKPARAASMPACAVEIPIT